MSSTSIPVNIHCDLSAIKVGDRVRGGRYSKHANNVEAIKQANSVSKEEKPMQRSQSDAFRCDRLSIPRNRGQVGRILSDVHVPFGNYHCLPDIPKTPPPDAEKQKLACERLTSVPIPFGNSNTRPPSPPMSEGPVVSAAEQKAYMEKLAAPPNPLTPHHVKRKQKEDKERIEHSKRLEKVREWQERQREKLSLMDPPEKVKRPKSRQSDVNSTSTTQTVCDSDHGSVFGDKERIQWGGDWQSVLQGLQTLEGKLDCERIPIRLCEEKKKERPVSAPLSPTAPTIPELAPLLDELLWVLIFALQGARALKSAERLEHLLLADVVPTLRKVGAVPVAPATLKRFEATSSRLTRSLTASKGDPTMTKDDLQLMLETCRDTLLRKDYVKSAFDFTVASDQ